MSGKTPVYFLREGNLADELLDLISEEKGISILVLAAAAGKKGPGPLVSALAGKASGSLRVPLTVVPGDLTDAEMAVYKVETSSLYKRVPDPPRSASSKGDRKS